jgi:hypothetical protein
MKLRFLLSALLLLPISAQAITVKGGRQCNEWTEIRAEAGNGKQAAKLDEMTTKYWIIGYLSALAGVQSDMLRNDPLKDTKNDKIYGSIDTFCQANPEQSLQDAITALWLDIARFKKKRN